MNIYYIYIHIKKPTLLYVSAALLHVALRSRRTCANFLEIIKSNEKNNYSNVYD